MGVIVGINPEIMHNINFEKGHFPVENITHDGKRLRDASIYTSKKYRSSFYS